MQFFCNQSSQDLVLISGLSLNFQLFALRLPYTFQGMITPRIFNPVLKMFGNFLLWLNMAICRQFFNILCPETKEKLT